MCLVFSFLFILLLRLLVVFFLVNCGTNWTVQYCLHHERKEGVRSIEKWSCIGNQLTIICCCCSSFGLFCLFCCVHSHVCIYVWVTCHMLDIWSGAHRGTIESNFFYFLFFYFLLQFFCFLPPSHVRRLSSYCSWYY